jgi:hypothetical protein
VMKIREAKTHTGPTDPDPDPNSGQDSQDPCPEEKNISLDEVTHAFSLCPVPSEAKLLCGLKSQVREFDLNLPGQTIFYIFYLDNVRNLLCEEKNLQFLSGEPELISKLSG